jgi:putative DNA primase/helicase
MMRDPIRERCRGRWPSILMQLGFPRSALSGQNVPCPMCGGTDRFRFSDRDGEGTYYCNRCGGANGTGGGSGGVNLVMAWKHLNYRGACELIETVVGKSALTRHHSERVGDDQVRAAMRWQWENATPLDGNDPVSFYLQGRAVAELPSPTAIRYAESMPDYDKVLKRKVYRPAMLARFTGEGRAVLHATYLTITGEKADVPHVKRFFNGCHVPAGGAVRLQPAAEEMGVSTGVETAMSAAQKYGLPVWATLSDGGLVKFEPPPECKRLTIFGDRDKNFSGQHVSYSLAYRLAQRPTLKVVVSLPPHGLKDFNEVVQAERDAKNVLRMKRNEGAEVEEEGRIPSVGGYLSADEG